MQNYCMFYTNSKYGDVEQNETDSYCYDSITTSDC